MATLLLRWLHNQGLASNDSSSSLESLCSDGSIILSLLVRHGYAPSSSLDNLVSKTDSLQRRAENFDLLEPYFSQIDLPFSTNLISQVILEEPGAASKLLMQVKRKLEDKDSEQASSRAMNRSNTLRHSAKSDKKQIREPDRDPAMIKAVRGELTGKDLDLTLHLAKFDKVRVENEKRIFLAEIDEKEKLERAMDVGRRRNIARLRENRKFLTEWIEQGQKSWQKNQSVKLERQRRELEFELTCKAREEAKTRKTSHEHCVDFVSGTEHFERNLKRLGLGEEMQQQLDDMQVLALSPTGQLARQERLQVQEKQMREAIRAGKQEDEQFLQRIRSQKLHAIQGRKDRDQRRRKIAVDQAKLQKQVEEKQEEKALLARLLQEAGQDRSCSLQQRKIRFQCQRRSRVGQLFVDSSVRGRDLAFRSLLLDRQAQRQQETDQSVAQLDLEEGANLELSSLALEQSALKREKHVALAEDTVNRLVHLVCQVAEKRSDQGTKTRKLSPQEWRELKADFVQGRVDPLESKIIDSERLVEPKVTPGEESPFIEEIQTWLRGLETQARTDVAGTTEVGCPMDDIFQTLRFVVSNVDIDPGNRQSFCSSSLSHRLPMNSGVLLLGQDEDLLQACATVLKFRFNVSIFSQSSYLNLARQKRANFAGSERAPPVPDSKKKPSERVDISASTRESLVEDLAMSLEVPEGGDISNALLPLESYALIRLIAFDILHSPEVTFALDRVCFTKDHVLALEYMLLPPEKRAELSFEQFLKADAGKKTDAPFEERAFQAFRFVIKQAQTESSMQDPFFEWVVARTEQTFEVPLPAENGVNGQQDDKQDGKQEDEQENMQDDTQDDKQVNRQELCTNVLDRLETDLVEYLSITQRDSTPNEEEHQQADDHDPQPDQQERDESDQGQVQEDLDMEEKRCDWELQARRLLRQHFEALELPSQFGHQPLDIDALRNLFAQLEKTLNRYESKARAAIHATLTDGQAMEDEVNKIVQLGQRLLRGDQPPSGTTCPHEVRMAVVQQWTQKMSSACPNEEASFQALDDGVEALSRELWAVSYEYSKLCRSVLSQWARENLWEQWIDKIGNAFTNLVDAECNFYTRLRELFKEYFACLDEKSRATEATLEDNKETHETKEDDAESAPKTLESYSPDLFGQIRNSLRTIARREERGESQAIVEDSYKASMIWLNNYTRRKILIIAKRSLEILSALQPKFEQAFAELSQCAVRRISEEDEMIRTLKTKLQARLRRSGPAFDPKVQPLKFWIERECEK